MAAEIKTSRKLSKKACKEAQKEDFALTILIPTCCFPFNCTMQSSMLLFSEKIGFMLSKNTSAKHFEIIASCRLLLFHMLLSMFPFLYKGVLNDQEFAQMIQSGVDKLKTEQEFAQRLKM